MTVHSTSEYRFSAALQFCKTKYGEPIGEGRHRVVFLDNDEVVKIPIQSSGECANHYELNNQGDHFAKTVKDEQLSQEFNLLVIRAEFVSHQGNVFADISDIPAWVWTIDCAQVGWTKNGRLVAYDWDIF